MTLFCNWKKKKREKSVNSWKYEFFWKSKITRNSLQAKNKTFLEINDNSMANYQTMIVKQIWSFIYNINSPFETPIFALLSRQFLVNIIKFLLKVAVPAQLYISSSCDQAHFWPSNSLTSVCVYLLLICLSKAVLFLCSISSCLLFPVHLLAQQHNETADRLASKAIITGTAT